MKRPSFGAGAGVTKAAVKLMGDVAKYLNINKTSEAPQINEQRFIVPNFINKNISTLSTINHSSIIIGNGDKIVAQYPDEGVSINNADKLFILTNSKDITLADMRMWSNRDVLAYCDMINVKCNINGYGYVSNQSVTAGTNITGLNEINLELNRTSDKVITSP
jgi:penicillin-binding protein 2B